MRWPLLCLLVSGSLATCVLAACSGGNIPTPRQGVEHHEAPTKRPPPNAPPDPIGTTHPGDRTCNADSDCKPGERCFAPDFTPGPGTPPPPPPKDAPAPPKCTDAQAPICAQNMRCNTQSGACERTACTASSDCDAGLCWHGHCYAHSGYCMPQSYCCPP